MRSFRTHFDYRDEKLHNHGHFAPVSPLRGAGNGEILEFLVALVEMSSETSQGTSNSIFDRRAVLYSSGIDDDGAEMSYLCHFGAGSHARAVPMSVGQSGAVQRDLHGSE